MKQTVRIMTPEQLVAFCRYRDGTSDYYDRMLMMAEAYVGQTEEPSLMGFEEFIIKYRSIIKRDCFF